MNINDVRNLRWCTQMENNSFEEHCHNLSKAKTGKPRSEETKNKISESTKGEKSYWYGKHLSEKTKKKKSEAMKGKHWKLENGHRIWY